MSSPIIPLGDRPNAIAIEVAMATGVRGSNSTLIGPGNPLPVTISDGANSEYETVAASQTNQVLGSTGAAGDTLSGLLVVPATTSPGVITITDGAGAAITVFAGGATSVSNLAPFPIPLGIKSTSGTWKVTTGTNISLIAIGNFT